MADDLDDYRIPSHAETRLDNRWCRCGVPLAERNPPCHWHPAGSADYAADLLAAWGDLIDHGFGQPNRKWWRRVLDRAETLAVRLGLNRT